MPNFTDRPFPWPHESRQNDNILPETGGNTRLLFAEQDNYRTRKGKTEMGDDATATSEEFSDTHANNLFVGAHATNTAAAEHANTNSITLTTSHYYYNTTNNVFRSFVSGPSTFEPLTGRSARTNSGRTIHIISDSDGTSDFASAKAAVEAGETQGVPSASDAFEASADNDNVSFIYYQTGSGAAVRRLTSYKASTGGQGTSDIFHVIPRVISADIAETTENIPVEFLKGSLSANKAQAGPLSFGNGFSIAASEHGLQLFLRTMTQSRAGQINLDESSSDGDKVEHVASGSETSLTNFETELDIPVGKSVRLNITVNRPTDNTDPVEIQIEGYDHEGTQLTEITRFMGTENTKTTDFYFATPSDSGDTANPNRTKYQVNDAPEGTTFKIESTYVNKVVHFTQPRDTQNQDLLPGWTIEVRKGQIPFTYVGVMPNEMSIALARDQALQMDFTIIAFDAEPYTSMDGRTIDTRRKDDNQGIEIRDSDGKYIKGYGDIPFIDASETLFTGWQAYLEIAEPGVGSKVTVPLTDATFTINHQLDQAQLIVGDRRPGPPFRSTLRDVMLDGSILFTRERDWVNLFRNNTDFNSPELVLRNAPAGGFPYELRIKMGKGQLMSSPDPQVSDLGLITQAFSMKFRESSSGLSDDFSFTIVTDNWEGEYGGLRVDGSYA